MKTLFIEKMDKPIWFMPKIKIEQENCKIYLNMQKTKEITKIIKKLQKYEVSNVVLSKELFENTNLINALNSNDIKIFDGRWLEKYLAISILDYIVIQKGIKKEETEIAITVNQITDLNIAIIKILAQQYKRITVVTNHIEKLQNIEKNIYEEYGILITISNNKKKSLLKPQLILNIDFNKELINKYRINENAVIVNLEGNIKIESKRFNGINVNDYEINVGREENIWRENIQNFRVKDLFEASIYSKENFESICNKIRKNKVLIKELYGINGKIERFS